MKPNNQSKKCDCDDLKNGSIIIHDEVGRCVECGSNLPTLLSKTNNQWVEEFENFMLEEYGKWKIGRAEAKSFIEKTLLQQRQEIVEMVEKTKSIHEEIIRTHEIFPKSWHEGNINMCNELITRLKEKE